MRRRILLALLLGAALTLGLAPAAYAHGERSQEAFLRMRTIGWTNVTFSRDRVKQGEDITIKGTAKVMNTWPTNLAKGNPNTGFMTVVAPCPLLILRN